MSRGRYPALSGAGYPRTVAAVDLYLDLLARTLTRVGFGDVERQPVEGMTRARAAIIGPVQAALRTRRMEVVRLHHITPEARESGRVWPREAETMVGLPRLRNLRSCIEQCLTDDVPGDILEAGVWRGGAAIYARAILAAHDVKDRTVWVADSFEGLPKPAAKWAAEDVVLHHIHNKVFAVGLDEVRRNFERYGMLDDQVRFLVGWFADTLPAAPVEQLAVLRLDGDMYGSTMDTLTPMFPKVQHGGFVIIDDYCLDPCRQAVHDYRDAHGITDPIEDIDGMGAYWRKT